MSRADLAGLLGHATILGATGIGFRAVPRGTGAALARGPLIQHAHGAQLLAIVRHSAFVNGSLVRASSSVARGVSESKSEPSTNLASPMARICAANPVASSGVIDGRTT